MKAESMGAKMVRVGGREGIEREVRAPEKAVVLV